LTDPCKDYYQYTEVEMQMADGSTRGVAFISRTVFFLKRPVVLLLIIGLAIRLALAPLLTYNPDVCSWALTLDSIRSGYGLYSVDDGYYYTPVWGYILGFLSLIQDALLNIDIMGIRFTNAFPIEVYGPPYNNALITSVEFNFWVKIPLIICDVLVGYLLYWLIKDRTGNEKKATLGFALWFLCPLVICISSVCGMFDTFSALFMLLAVILVYKDRCFLGGAMFAIAVLTKFFPGILIFLLVAYVLRKHREDGQARRKLLEAFVGAVLAFFVIMLPEILDGTFIDSFSFITSRLSGSGLGTGLGVIETVATVVLYSFIIVVSAYLAFRLYRSKEDVDVCLFRYILMTLAILFLYPALPQYIVLIVPMLAYAIVVSNRRYLTPWVVLSIGTTLYAMSSTFSMLLSVGAFTNIVSLDWVVSMIEWMQTETFGIVNMDYLMYGGGIIQYIGILLILWTNWKVVHGREADPDGC
jgi:hypothetical protein